MDIYQISKGLARDFLRKNNITTPFDIQKALKCLHIILIYQSFNKTGAFILYEGKRKIIIANNNYDIETQRFFIAHEIAHIILRHNGIDVAYVKRKHKTYWEDKTADICARELLMPGDELRQAAYIYKYDVQRLKEHFIVPELELVIRMKKMDLPFWNTVYKNF